MTATRAQLRERQEIRAWMAEVGMEPTRQGKIPAGARRQWLAARTAPPPALPADPPADPDDDWTEADAADAGDDLTEAGPPPEDQARPPAGFGHPFGPAMSLEDARAQVAAQARRPAWAGGGRDAVQDGQPAAGRSLFGVQGQGQGAAVVVTKTVRGDIEGKLALLLSIPAMTWQLADPYCGGAFSDAAPDIAKKMTPLICQSPDAVRWFTKGTTFIMVLELLIALQPVGTAVWQHHRPGAERDAHGQPDGPQPRQDLGAYTTQVNGHVPAYRAA
jgi:hypothetical protein